MRKLIEFKLKFLSKLILKKYQPKIIGVTGSIGKTSTREAIYTVLSGTYTVRRNAKDDNNNLEVLLTIIGFNGRKRNYFSLIKANLKALKILTFKDKNYPQILVLEIGVNRRGQMRHILKNIKPYIGVVTSIGPVHLEHFRDVDEIIEEKGRLVSSLAKDSWAVLNKDDKNVAGLDKKTKAQVLTYGFDKSADISADNVKFTYVEDEEDVNNLRGLSFKVKHEGSTVPIFLPNSLGVGQVYAALSAIAVGVTYGINLVDIAARLKAFQTPNGRMTLISGIKDTAIIDNSYKASPVAVDAALDVLEKIIIKRSHRRIAVIGDMLELGAYTIKSHQEIGKKIAKSNIDLLILIGEKSRDIARGAKKAGMDEKLIMHYDFSRQAVQDIEDIVKAGDLILVTGSSKMKMELIVKEIMAEPQRAAESLVRQDA